MRIPSLPAPAVPSRRAHLGLGLAFALVAGCVAAVVALPGLAAAARTEASAGAVRLGRLHYGGGGDWYANPTSLPNLARAMRERLGMDVDPEEGRVAPLDDELFDFPFLHMTGHGNVRFTTEEAERLRWWLTHGGFLFADDNYGMDESFRKEIRKVLPDAELVELPFDHGIYHAVYSFDAGLPKIHEHHGGPPHGYGLFHEGRLVVFYSYNTDIGDGLEDEEVHHDPDEVREQALRMALNVVSYAMTH